MAKETSPDKIQLDVVVNGSETRKDLAEVKQDVIKLGQEQKKLRLADKEATEAVRIARAKGDAQAIKDARALQAITQANLARNINEIDVKETRMQELRKELGATGLSANELRGYLGRLKKELNTGLFVEGSKEYQDKAAEIALVEQRYKDVATTMGRAKLTWEEERKSLSLNTMTTEQLKLETQRLQDVLRKPDGSATEKAQAAADLELVKDRTEQLTNATRINAAAWEVQRKGMKLTEMETHQLAMETDRLKAIMAKASTTGPERAKAARELALVKDRTEQLTNANRIAADAWEHQRKGMKLTEMSMAQLRMESARLKAKLEVMDPGDATLVNTRKALQQTEKRIKSLESGLGPFGRAWQSVKVQVASAGAVIGAMFAGGAIMSGMRNMVKSAAEYSDAIADVRKTTGLSLPVVKELSKELSGMDTRTSRKELLELARDAGKLGLSAKEDVMSFVKAGNQIRVALGEDLGDDAIKNIGKLVDLFKLKDTFGLEQSMLKVGSAINELGMSSTASEGYMVEFMKRMGGIAPLAGITIQQTLALGATLDSLGQTSEVSSTALSKILVKLGQDVPKYAGLAGMSIEQFSATLKKSALDGLVAVLEGTKKTEGGMEALAATLGDVGIDSARAAGVFGVLAENTDRLREQTVIANKAFQDGSSVTDEYEIKNTNLAATLAKLSREFNRLIASNRVVAIFESLANGARNAVDWLKRNADMISFMARVLATATMAWVNYRIVGELWAKRAIITTAITKGLALAQGLFTGATNLATVATKAFNTALKANPLGLVASLLTTVIGLFFSFGDEVNAATTAQVAHNRELSETARLLKAIDDAQDKTNVLAKLSKEQLEAHKQDLENLLASLSTEEAAVVAAEERKSGAIIAAQKRRNQEILDLEAELATEQDQKRRFDLEFRLEDAKSSYRAEYDTRRATGKEITKAEADRRKEDLRQQIAAADAELAQRRKHGKDTVRTLGEIDADIKAIKDKQGVFSSTSAEYDAYERELVELGKERARITGERSRAGQAQAQENLDALEASMREWREKMRQETLDDDAKELAQLDAKHAQELQKYKEQQDKLIKAGKLTPEQADADTAEQERLNLLERTALIEKHGDAKAAAMREANEKIQAILGEGHNAELQADVTFYEQEIEKGKAANRNVLELERAHKDAVLKLYEQNAKDLEAQEVDKWKVLIDLAKKKLEDFDAANAKAGITPDDAVLADRKTLSDGILALETAQAKAVHRINNERRRKEREAEHAFNVAMRQETIRKLQNFAMVANAANEFANSITQYMDADIQAAEIRADQDEVRTEEEIANIERMKKARRDAALTAIAVQSAVAIANGIASAMSLPWPANLAAAISTVATVVGLMAQAKALMNQSGNSSNPQDGGAMRPALQGVPEGAVGGELKGNTFTPADKAGGILKGPSHSDGGLGVYNEKTGERVAEFEGDEAYMLMSRAFTSANRDQLGLLMEASRTGARLNLTGPQLPQPSAKSVRMALSSGVSMAQGGITSADLSGLLSSSSKPMDLSETNDLLRMLAQRIQRVEEATVQQRTKLKAVVALNPSYDREMNDWANLRARNRIARKKT